MGTAGEDQRGQIELIYEAVGVAVGRLTLKTRGGEYSEVRQEELDQLRCLLGLTPETRWLPWGKRQQAAASVAGLDVETFRRQPQASLLYLVAMSLVDGARVHEATPSASTRREELTIYSAQQELDMWLIPHIRTERPQIARMVLLSSASNQPVLAALRGVRCEIQLLLCHPDEAVTEWQKRHIKTSVEDMRSIGFEDYDNLHILFYHSPASLRGWQIGDYVGLSWYTYRDDLRLEADDPEQRAMYGHDNITIVANCHSELGGKLCAWFKREFSRLQGHRMTKPDETLFPTR